MLEISTDELGLEFTDPRNEKVLLCLPDDQSTYRFILTALFARYGYASVIFKGLEKVPVVDPPYIIGIACITGSVGDFEQARADLKSVAQNGIILSNSKDIPPDGINIGENTMLIRQVLDINLLNSIINNIATKDNTDKSQ